MKKIIVTEAQLCMLAEEWLDDKTSSIKRHPGSVVSTQVPMEDNEGEPEYSEPVTSDDYGKIMTTQRGIRGYNCRWR